MKNCYPVVFVCFALLLLTNLSQASDGPVEKWTTKSGQEIEAIFYCEIGGRSYFGGNALYNFPTNILIEADQKRVQEYNQQRKPNVLWKNSDAHMSQLLKDKLYVLEGDELVKYSVGERIEPDFYVFYFGASWCGPCKQFVKYLRTWYHSFLDHEISNFEVIFVSSDHTKKKQLRYVVEESMPWPVTKWKKRPEKGIREYKRKSIPGLVVVDREGNILHDAHSGAEYRGAHAVLEELKQLIFRTNKNNPMVRRSYFEKILDRVKKTLEPDAQSQPTPIYTFIRKSAREKIGNVQCTVVIKITNQGRVSSVQIEEPLPDEVSNLLMREIESWLFIPKISNGRLLSCKVKIPVSVEKPSES